MSSLTTDYRPTRASASDGNAGNAASATLRPKEHGAYAILLIPIVTALAIAGLSVAGMCVAIAAIAGFFAHEPLLVVLGHRGSRAQREAPGARQRLLLLLAISTLSGSLALGVGPPAAQWSLLGCGALAASSFALAVAGKHKTLGGQLWGVIGLSAPCLPILLSGGFTPPAGLEVWSAWLIGFSATTLAVRGLIAAQKRRSRTIVWLAISTLTLLVTGLASFGITLPLAATPMLVMSWYLMFDPPPAKQLKKVGWTLVSGTIASAVGMIVVMS